MNEQARQQRNTSRMAELHPNFAQRIGFIIRDLEALAYRPRIQEAYRSPAKQKEAFNNGRSKLEFGFHNVTGLDGRPESLAVDLLDDDNPLNPSRHYLLHLAHIAGKYNCNTGILWGLPSSIQESLILEIQAVGEDVHRTRPIPENLKIGWDPTHVEPSDITVGAAKNGHRPPALPE